LTARDNEDEFYASWKRYRAANPSNAGGRADTDELESENIMRLLDGESDGPGMQKPALLQVALQLISRLPQRLRQQLLQPASLLECACGRPIGRIKNKYGLHMMKIQTDMYRYGLEMHWLQA
jgi:hypothetical protein